MTEPKQPTKAPPTDLEKLDYLNQVLRRLDALHKRTPENSELYELATNAFISVDELAAYFIATTLPERLKS